MNNLILRTIYPTVLSIDNILDNRNNKRNPLKIIKTDYQKPSHSIDNYNWLEILDFTDVNKATQYFTDTIDILKCQASTAISISSKTKKLKLYATTVIINSIRQRYHLHSLVKKYLLNLKLKDYYVKFKNKITNI